MPLGVPADFPTIAWMVSEAEKLAAAVCALGLRLGTVTRDAVVAWADREIALRDQADDWLVGVSLSRNMHVLDLISLLKQVADDLQGERVFRATIALLDVQSQMGFDEAERLAARVYRAAFDCCAGDWCSELLREADQVDDGFALARDGISTREEAVDRFREFIVETRIVELPTTLRELTIQF